MVLQITEKPHVPSTLDKRSHICTSICNYYYKHNEGAETEHILQITPGSTRTNSR